MSEENIEVRGYVYAFGVMYTKVEMKIFWKELLEPDFMVDNLIYYDNSFVFSNNLIGKQIY